MQIGFLGLLGIVFIILKLTGVIDWNWWWVTSPLWGGYVLIAVLYLFAYFIVKPVLHLMKEKKLKDNEFDNYNFD